MAIIERTYGKETNAVINELLISSDLTSSSPRVFGKNNYRRLFRTAPPILAGKGPTTRPAAPRTRTSASPRWLPTGSAPKCSIRPWLEVLEPRRSRVGGSLRAGLQRLAHRLLQRRPRTAYRYRHAVDVRHRRRRE